MKYKEAKTHYKSGQLSSHCFLDESGNSRGEYRYYHENGQLSWHRFGLNGREYGEVKWLNGRGTLHVHCLIDSKGNILANVIRYGIPSTHSEEQLIQIAKEHGLPLLSETPKTEEEVTLWNLKHPACPCLPNAST